MLNQSKKMCLITFNLKNLFFLLGDTIINAIFPYMIPRGQKSEEGACRTGRASPYRTSFHIQFMNVFLFLHLPCPSMEVMTEKLRCSPFWQIVEELWKYSQGFFVPKWDLLGKHNTGTEKWHWLCLHSGICCHLGFGSYTLYLLREATKTQMFGFLNADWNFQQ